jgi:predicted amidophosphoribosyltransferase
MWAGRNFILAVKGEAMKGKYAHVPDVHGRKTRFTREQPGPAVAVFALWAANAVRDSGMAPATLVGVPSSKSTIADKAACRTEVLAQMIAAHYRPEVGVKAEPLIRFNQRMPSAHKENGPRSPHQLFPFLATIGAGIEKDRPYVLVDDVCTTGGHLRACAALIAAQGGRVMGAICAGRTTQERVNSVFGTQMESFDDYMPNALFFRRT